MSTEENSQNSHKNYWNFKSVTKVNESPEEQLPLEGQWDGYGMVWKSNSFIADVNAAQETCIRVFVLFCEFRNSIKNIHIVYYNVLFCQQLITDKKFWDVSIYRLFLFDSTWSMKLRTSLFVFNLHWAIRSSLVSTAISEVTSLDPRSSVLTQWNEHNFFIKLNILLFKWTRDITLVSEHLGTMSQILNPKKSVESHHP